VKIKQLSNYLIGACSLLLIGCDTVHPPVPDNLGFAPASPHLPLDGRNNHGAIYNANTSLAWFETLRARRVGDILTVTLQEVTDAEKKAETTQKKTSKTKIANPTLLGVPVALPGGKTLGFDMSSDNNFSGSATSKQSNKLSGSITVSVYQVLSNGYLKVRGEKWIKINRGREYIRLRGIVRQVDIRPDNTVPSFKIANARIEYSGTGQVADSSNMGALAKFFNSGFWIY